MEEVKPKRGRPAKVEVPASPAAEPKSKSSTPKEKENKPHHPPYLKMVMEAISFLKERSGSSQQAIAKYIEEKYKSGLPASFKRILSLQLKVMSKNGKITKVKHSFKLPAEAKKKASNKSTTKTAKAKVEEAAPKVDKGKGESKVSTRKRAVKDSAEGNAKKRKVAASRAAPKSPKVGSRISSLRSSGSRGVRASPRIKVTEKKLTPSKVVASKARKVVPAAKRARRAVAK